MDVLNCVDFFVLDKIKLKRELPQQNIVESFKIENRLKPTGLILVVMLSKVSIHNFDEQYDKKNNSC